MPDEVVAPEITTEEVTTQDVPVTIEGPEAMAQFAHEAASAPNSGGPGAQIVENAAQDLQALADSQK